MLRIGHKVIYQNEKWVIEKTIETVLFVSLEKAIDVLRITENPDGYMSSESTEIIFHLPNNAKSR